MAVYPTSYRINAAAAQTPNGTNVIMAENMKRRRFFKTMAVLPAAPALIAQQAPPSQTPPAQPPVTPVAPAPPTGRAGGGGRFGGNNIPAFEETSPELVAVTELRFFSPIQYSALTRLCALLMPPLGGNPGAVECQAPEFLDFLIGASLPDRQKLYRDGLDTLNANAKKKFKKNFSELNDADADAVVRPLLAPVAWAYDLPKDPGQHFMAEAKRDIRTATQNSRAWADVGAAAGRRRFGGGNYINPIDPIYRS